MKERKGRMINKDISNSSRFASLSPEAAVLFTMLIPHYNSHGKMNGGPGYIKDEVCPKISYLNTKTIPGLLKEISDKTNVKWFKNDGRYWIHSINFLSEHQDLDPKRLGKDHLPDFSLTSQEQGIPEVEVEVEEEGVSGQGKDSKKKPIPNPSVRVVCEYLVKGFTDKQKDPPVLSYGRINKQIKKLLEVDKFKEDALMEMIDWFLMSPKFKEHPIPSAAISDDTAQRWKTETLGGL